MNATAIRRALYGRLAGDTTLTGLLGTPPAGYAKSIFYQEAPDAAGFPFVVFAKQSGVPTYANATKPAFESEVWLVKAVDRATTADRAEAIADRADALLADASLSIAGGATVMWLRRQSDVDYPELVGGVRYAHTGSLYRLVFEPA